MIITYLTTAYFLNTLYDVPMYSFINIIVPYSLAHTSNNASFWIACMSLARPIGCFCAIYLGLIIDKILASKQRTYLYMVYVIMFLFTISRILGISMIFISHNPITLPLLALMFSMLHKTCSHFWTEIMRRFENPNVDLNFVFSRAHGMSYFIYALSSPILGILIDITQKQNHNSWVIILCIVSMFTLVVHCVISVPILLVTRPSHSNQETPCSDYGVYGFLCKLTQLCKSQINNLLQIIYYVWNNTIILRINMFMLILISWICYPIKMSYTIETVIGFLLCIELSNHAFRDHPLKLKFTFTYMSCLAFISLYNIPTWNIHNLIESYAFILLCMVSHITSLLIIQAYNVMKQHAPDLSILSILDISICMPLLLYILHINGPDFFPNYILLTILGLYCANILETPIKICLSAILYITTLWMLLHGHINTPFIYSIIIVFTLITTYIWFSLYTTQHINSLIPITLFHNILCIPWTYLKQFISTTKNLSSILWENSVFMVFSIIYFICGLGIMSITPLYPFYFKSCAYSYTWVSIFRGIGQGMGMTCGLWLAPQILWYWPYPFIMIACSIFGIIISYTYLYMSLTISYIPVITLSIFFLLGISSGIAEFLWIMSPLWFAKEDSIPIARINSLLMGCRGLVAPCIGTFLCKYLGFQYVICGSIIFFLIPGVILCFCAHYSKLHMPIESLSISK